MWVGRRGKEYDTILFSNSLHVSALVDHHRALHINMKVYKMKQVILLTLYLVCDVSPAWTVLQFNIHAAI
jgi:hypothetical protein